MVVPCPPLPPARANPCAGLYSAHRDLLQTSAAILDKFKLGVVCTSGIHPNGTKVTAASKSPCTGNEVGAGGGWRWGRQRTLRSSGGGGHSASHRRE